MAISSSAKSSVTTDTDKNANRQLIIPEKCITRRLLTQMLVSRGLPFPHAAIKSGKTFSYEDGMDLVKRAGLVRTLGDDHRAILIDDKHMDDAAREALCQAVGFEGSADVTVAGMYDKVAEMIQTGQTIDNEADRKQAWRDAPAATTALSKIKAQKNIYKGTRKERQDVGAASKKASTSRSAGKPVPIPARPSSERQRDLREKKKTAAVSANVCCPGCKTKLNITVSLSE